MGAWDNQNMWLRIVGKCALVPSWPDGGVEGGQPELLFQDEVSDFISCR